MLSSRNVRTAQGKLAVEVAYPRRLILARMLRQLPWKSAVVGSLIGFCFSAYQHSSGRRPERGPAAMRELGVETVVWGAAGGTAGLTGALAYGCIGGPAGALAAFGAAALVASGAKAALPALAAMPRQANTSVAAANWSLTAIRYSPVVDKDIKEDAPPTAPIYAGPRNDKVVYLGMNAPSTLEATRRLQRYADVTVIIGNKLQDRVQVGNRLFDLRSRAGILNFAVYLGFDATRTNKIVEAFTMCDSGARDELGKLALIWAAGEKGHEIPSRLVLAGHSNGDGVWGDNNGSLRLGPLLQLSRALPHATAQIEDAFVTGCYSGGEVTMDQYLLIFPRARTIWAYESQAPGVDNGASIDQAGWERATRGRALRVPPLASASAGKNLAIWTCQPVGGGRYHAERPILTVDQMRGKVQWMEEHFFRPAMRGETVTYDQGWRIPIGITDPHTGLVRQYYSWLVRLTQCKNLPEEERLGWVAKKHQVIRLLYYYDTVAPHFQANYGSQVKSAYSSLGLKAPDYGDMGRAAALSAVNGYLYRLGQSKHASAQAQQVGTLLERGVKDLDPSVIPDGWV